MFEIKRLVEKLKFLLHFSSKPPGLHLSEIHSPSDDVEREPPVEVLHPGKEKILPWMLKHIYIFNPSLLNVDYTVVQIKIKKAFTIRLVFQNLVSLTLV